MPITEYFLKNKLERPLIKICNSYLPESTGTNIDMFYELTIWDSLLKQM